MTRDPEIPTPRRILSIGAPKQALKPMMGANVATERLATKSAREFPMANTVRPTMASDRPKTKPNV